MVGPGVVAVLGAVLGDPAAWGLEAAFPAVFVALLFAALIAVLAFEEGGVVVLDARAAGVAVGAIAVWRKAPLIVVVILAMAVTAGLRALL